MKRFCFSMFLAMGLVAMAGLPVWAHGGGGHGGGGGHSGGGHSGGGEHHSGEGEHHGSKEGNKEGGKGKEGKEGEHHGGEAHNNNAHHEGEAGQHHGEQGNKQGNNQHTNGQPGNHNAGNHSLSPEQHQNLNNRLNAAHNHPNPDANRGDHRDDHHDWANNVRDNFHNNYHDYHHWFGGDWWAGHPGAYAGWYNRFGGDRPWSYWWGVPAWGGLTDWMGGEWSQPVNYGYGDNVTYQDDSVNVNGQPVASQQDYNQSAFDLASRTPPAPQPAQPGDNASASGANLMPLGVFALSTNKDDQNPTRVLQLAAGKDGTIAGTFFNKATDTVLPVQGTIDRASQRVCFTIGDDKQTVLETGIYNLTQKDAPVLIHQGNSKQETGELVRLTQPSADAPATSSLPSNSLGVKN